MSTSEENVAITSQKKYKGIRRRKWGKWVSEIRVPGTQDRLWLGSYATPEAAAVAHDMAFLYLRGTSSPDNFNFPHLLPSSLQKSMSPRSIQKVASDAGMAIDAQLVVKKSPEHEVKASESYVVDGLEQEFWEDVVDGNPAGTWEGGVSREGDTLSISIEDYL